MQIASAFLRPELSGLRAYWRHLRGLEGLSSFDIDDSRLAITAAGLEPLVSLPHLTALRVDAKDDWMPYIARIPHLRSLGIQDTTAGDDGFVALSQSRSIEHIWGRRCHNLRTRGFLALATMPALRSLSVSCLNVSDDGIAMLPAFPALRELMPMDIPDAGYRHAGGPRRLRAGSRGARRGVRPGWSTPNDPRIHLQAKPFEERGEAGTTTCWWRARYTADDRHFTVNAAASPWELPVTGGRAMVCAELIAGRDFD